jgi:hypothetical protein
MVMEFDVEEGGSKWRRVVRSGPPPETSCGSREEKGGREKREKDEWRRREGTESKWGREKGENAQIQQIPPSLGAPPGGPALRHFLFSVTHRPHACNLFILSLSYFR